MCYFWSFLTELSSNRQKWHCKLLVMWHACFFIVNLFKNKKKFLHLKKRADKRWQQFFVLLTCHWKFRFSPTLTFISNCHHYLLEGLVLYTFWNSNGKNPFRFCVTACYLIYKGHVIIEIPLAIIYICKHVLRLSFSMSLKNLVFPIRLFTLFELWKAKLGAGVSG